ncbi:MAG TPA: PAS domain S-box protein [Noviherbaspirillum sp.]|uniref:PAS domain S-box protein n=1 Tax=Noviherbaspirillum sp. TaxID=1926288 RepID=UPI002D25103F|nr:PAS domain S-box protein [Noviherbaspirillum sp.]HYD94397.1 PAS domain S-box protein [Noviherbaspirillum sp.]
MLENSNDLIAAVDSELRLIALNAPFRREFELVFGKPLESGDRLDEMLAHLTHDRDKARSLCRRALAGESFRVVEEFGDEQLLRKSYELAFSPIFDTHHQPIFAAIVVRDLTMLRMSEQRFGALLEAAPDATIIMGPHGKIDLANAHAERMFGYERHQMLGLPVEKLIPKRFHARHISHRHRFARRAAARPMGSGRSDLLGLRADGSEFPVEISLNPLDVAGERMVVAAIRDMTLRQQTEDQLRALSIELERRVTERTSELEQASKNLRATFEQASVGIAHVSPMGRWLRVNQTLCNIVGYTSEELSTLTFQDITHPDDLDADLGLMYRLLNGDIPSYALDKRYLDKDGEIVWINLNVSLVRDNAGAPQYFIAVVKDIDARKRAEAELQKHKERLELAITATGLGLFDYSPPTGRADWSPELKAHFGLSTDAQADYDVFLQGVHEEDRQRAAAALQAAMRGVAGGRFHIDYRTVGLEDARERWIEARGRVFFDEKGKPVRCIGSTLDVTEKKLAEVALQERERELRIIFDANPVGTVTRTVTGEVLEANSAYLRIIGRTREELLARRLRWDDLTPPEYLGHDRRAMNEALRRGVSGQYEKEYLRADGTRVPVLFACAATGKDNELVAFVLDISERKRAEERIRQAALHDPLTGLPNRALLFDYAKHVFGRARREGTHSGILFIDLDRFKPINDNHGHEVGDEVLKEVAGRISCAIRAEDMVFRLGGDEFLVLLPEIDDDANAGDVARHMAECVNQPYKVGGLELSLSTSVGISIFPRDGDDIDTLINHADAAMYQAKQAGRNNVQFYSKELAARSQLQTRIEQQLKAALNQNTFQLFYQPVVDMRSARLIGVEALLRWSHDDIGPDQFVPIAEATGQINSVGEWVIAEACRQHKAWCEQGLPPIPIAVNVSAVQLRNKDFAEQFALMLGEYAVDAAALQVEVTETALMENLERAIDVLAQLRGLGVTIALDDFGTGYSSLNYLSRLPINKIKVDKSFVQRIEHDKASRAITEAVIALGRSLKLEVVAEGIESEEALQYLRLHGCSQAQGYHVCKPVAPDAFESWYRQNGAASQVH